MFKCVFSHPGTKICSCILWSLCVDINPWRFENESHTLFKYRIFDKQNKLCGDSQSTISTPVSYLKSCFFDTHSPYQVNVPSHLYRAFTYLLHLFYHLTHNNDTLGAVLDSTSSCMLLVCMLRDPNKQTALSTGECINHTSCLWLCQLCSWVCHHGWFGFVCNTTRTNKRKINFQQTQEVHAKCACGSIRTKACSLKPEDWSNYQWHKMICSATRYGCDVC